MLADLWILTESLLSSSSEESLLSELESSEQYLGETSSSLRPEVVGRRICWGSQDPELHIKSSSTKDMHDTVASFSTTFREEGGIWMDWWEEPFLGFWVRDEWGM